MRWRLGHGPESPRGRAANGLISCPQLPVFIAIGDSDPMILPHYSYLAQLAQVKGDTPGQVRAGMAAGPVPMDRADPWHQTARPAGGERRRDTGGTVRRRGPDLDATAARLGVHGNRYNDLHMNLVGRWHDHVIPACALSLLP